MRFDIFVLREMVFGLDAQFSEEAMIQRINADLANNLGNCFSRSLTMIEKYCDGTVPGPEEAGPAEEALKNLSQQVGETVKLEAQRLAFHKALMSLWELIDEVNKYIDTQAPWALAKDTGEKAEADDGLVHPGRNPSADCPAPFPLYAPNLNPDETAIRFGGKGSCPDLGRDNVLGRVSCRDRDSKRSCPVSPY